MLGVDRASAAASRPGSTGGLVSALASLLGASDGRPSLSLVSLSPASLALASPTSRGASIETSTNPVSGPQEPLLHAASVIAQSVDRQATTHLKSTQVEFSQSLSLTQATSFWSL